MFGNTTYELSLVKDYVAHWGLAEAARELVQNALDGESPFKYSFEPAMLAHNQPGWTFHLNSEYAKLDAKTLLLGATSKATNADAIGSFGEGYKIALLVLTRLGHPVTIYNGDVVWTPQFRYSKRYDTELLNIVETRSTGEHPPGLTFVVEGLDDADRAAIEECSLKMQKEIGEVRKTCYGDILMDRPGGVYVGSLYVCKTDMKYGYDIKPEFIKLERDRQTVAGWELNALTRDMWFETEQFDQIAELIHAEAPDLAAARYSAPEIVKEACYALFIARNPGALIASSPTELKEMVSRGLVNTVFLGNSVYSVVSTAPSYLTTNRSVVAMQSPREFLIQWLATNRGEMRSKSIESFKKGVVAEAKKWRTA